MSKLLILPFVVLLVVAANAGAKPKVNCTTVDTQNGLDVCAGRREPVAIKKLDKSYRALVCHLDAGEKLQFEESQRAWERFRKLDCAFMAGGGSISVMNESNCRADLDIRRAMELDTWPPNTSRDGIVPCAKQ